MSECLTSAKCSDEEYRMAREAGLLVVSVEDEVAIHRYAKAVRADLLGALEELADSAIKDGGCQAL